LKNEPAYDIMIMSYGGFFKIRKEHRYVR